MSEGPTTGVTQAELQHAPSSAQAGSDGPKTLRVSSPGFYIPFGIALVLIATAWVGLQGIVSSTGPWAIQAAQKGLAESGLPSTDRAELTLEIERLNAALSAESVEVQAAVSGVDGLLKEPLIPQLLIQDVIGRRLPASGFDDAQQAAARETLQTFASYVDAGLLNYGHGIKVLGPLTSVSDDGAPPELDDAGLTELVTRASKELELITPAQLKDLKLKPVSRKRLLDDYAARIDGILAR